MASILLQGPASPLPLPTTNNFVAVGSTHRRRRHRRSLSSLSSSTLPS